MHGKMKTIQARNDHYSNKHSKDFLQQTKPLKPFKVVSVNRSRKQTWSIYRQCGYCPKQLTRNNFEHYKNHRTGKLKRISVTSKWRNPAEVVLNDNEWYMMNDWRLRSLKPMFIIMDECVEKGSLVKLQKFIRDHRKCRKINWERWQFSDDVLRDEIKYGGTDKHKMYLLGFQFTLAKHWKT